MDKDLSRREFIGGLGAVGIAAGLGAAISANRSVSAMAGPAGVKQPHVVFVTGDDEYRSEISMPMIAKILETKHNMRCSIVYSVDPVTGARDPRYQVSVLEGLEALKTADLAMFFLRFRRLPDEQFNMIMDYVNSGRPIIGLRTSTHAFNYPEGHKLEKWNERFGIEVFGQKWISHQPPESGTKASVIAEKADHPILRGVKKEFYVRHWLYDVLPLHGDCEPLLDGVAAELGADDKPTGKTFGPHSPLAWTKTYKGAPVFFTTLGHPKDFEVESARRVLVNGIYWALGKDVPSGGGNVDIRYVGPKTHKL